MAATQSTPEVKNPRRQLIEKLFNFNTIVVIILATIAALAAVLLLIQASQNVNNVQTPRSQLEAYLQDRNTTEEELGETPMVDNPAFELLKLDLPYSGLDYKIDQIGNYRVRVTATSERGVTGALNFLKQFDIMPDSPIVELVYAY